MNHQKSDNDIKRNKITYIPKPLPSEGFVRKPTFIAVLGISKSSFHNGIKSGLIPPGKLLTTRCRVWDVSDIRAFLDSIKKGGAQ